MPKLSGTAKKLVDLALDRYGVPNWVRPYIYKYAARNKLNTIKLAIGFISTGRRKGKIEKDKVILPNGMSFKMTSIAKLLNLFFYGAENIAKLEEHWASVHTLANPDYTSKFLELSAIDYKRARAVKNLMEGLKHPVQEEPKSIKPIFDRLAKIDNWNERVIATGIILNYSFIKTFGGILFRSFYPTAPEFMRSLGKAFTTKDGGERWDITEARVIIKSGAVPQERILQLSREIMTLVKSYIDTNMPLATELNLREELALMEEASIAYPFHVLSGLGISMDAEKEIADILKSR